MTPACTSAAKADRLRQAKAEAEKEIAAYRAEREGAYQKKVAEASVAASIAAARRGGVGRRCATD